jgi:hypothetical protein
MGDRRVTERHKKRVLKLGFSRELGGKGGDYKGEDGSCARILERIHRQTGTLFADRPLAGTKPA